MPLPAPWLADYREILKLAVPIALGSAASMISRLVDVAMMGRSSVAGLAGVAAGVAIQAFFGSVVLAAASGHQVLAPRRFGMNKPKWVGTALTQSFFFAGVIAAASVVVLLSIPAQLVGLLTDSGAVTHEGVRYILARAPGLLFAVPTTLLIITLNSVGETRWSFYASIVAALTNVSLDYVLIFGFGSIPAMGALGNGLSSTISEVAALLFVLAVVYRKGLHRSLGVTRPVLVRRDLRLVRNLSLPAITSMALDFFGSAVLFSFVGRLGTTALAMGRIALTVLQLLFVVTMSFATASQLLAGRAWGARDAAAIVRYRRRVLELAMFVGLLLSVPLWSWPGAIARLFTGFPAVVDSAAGPLGAVALCVPVMVWAYGNVAVLRAMGRLKADMLANIGSVWLVQIPAAYCLGVVVQWGLPGILLGMVAYWSSRALLTQAMLAPAFTRWQMRASATT